MSQYKANIKYLFFILSLGLVGCLNKEGSSPSNSTSENNDVTPFNLISISASDGQAKFEWTGETKGVTHTICMKNNDAANPCVRVGKIMSSDNLSLRLDSSHKASQSAFFIMAEKNGVNLKSNEMQIDIETINNLTPFIQTTNPTLENATFADNISISGNGLNLAVSSVNTDIVYIYRYDRLTGWILEAAINAPTLEANFGSSLSFNDNGSLLVVGAKMEGSRTGAAYIYANEGKTWKNIKRFSGHEASTLFGSAVSFSANGKRLAIGSPGNESTTQTTGSVSIYTDNGNDWNDPPVIIKPEDSTVISHLFGHSVSLSANGFTLAVGAYGEGSPKHKFAGAGYVFTQLANQWVQEAHITLPNPTDFQYFAKTVSLNDNGDQLALTHSGSSSVRLYNKETKWADALIINPPNINTQESFGSTLAFRGNTLAVGAPNESSSMMGIISTEAIIENNHATSSGAVYLYHHKNGIWSLGSLIKSSSINPYHFFGTSVALSEQAEKLAIGAPANESNEGKNDASVYFY